MNPVYNLWNYEYIQQQVLQQHHQNQIMQVIDSARKLQDFLDSTDRVDSNYQSALLAECCAVVYNYGKKHNLF